MLTDQNGLATLRTKDPEVKPILSAARHPEDLNPPDLLPEHGEQVLLIHPPVFDTRIHWPRWQQPLLLLELAAYCRTVGASAQLIDMLYHRSGVRLRRQRVSIIDLDGIKVNKWRFGLLKSALVNQLREMARSGYQPDKVYVECFTTFWWEGAAEVIDVVKERFPATQVILIGAYGSLAPEHARACTRADVIFSGAWPQIATLPTDLSLYEPHPSFAYISLGGAQRTAADIVDEIAWKHTHFQVQHFAFADSAIVERYANLYRSILELLVSRAVDVNFYALGNIAPSDLVAQPELAYLMRRAGYNQIFFSDDRNIAQNGYARAQLIEHYRLATDICIQAGFPARTQSLSASISLGRLGEDLAERASLATILAHHVGSVIFWPYQPSLSECPHIPLEEQNSKLFPLRNANGYLYRDYLNVMGLGAVLNSKYRTRTFDFLGDELIPRLFRDSIARHSWQPAEDVKGDLKLPMRVIPVVQR